MENNVVIPGLTRNPATLTLTSLDTGFRRYDGIVSSLGQHMKPDFAAPIGPVQKHEISEGYFSKANFFRLF